MGKLKEKATRYSEAFDGPSPLRDEASRAAKAAKIRAILDAEGVFERAEPRILDIGCAYGLILKSLTPDDGLGVGIDLDVSTADRTDTVKFVRGDAEALPFQSGSFDVVICNHVYEHTDNAPRLVSEIRRVMAADAVCYFAGPNKYEPIEPHYRLPFLSWLPRPLAHIYMRVTRKGQEYPEKPYSRRGLRRLLADFDVTDYTERIVRNPVRYQATDMLRPNSAKRWIADMLLRTAPFFFPGFVFVLRKTDRNG
jgi:SAM-dependent methyltransferase